MFFLPCSLRILESLMILTTTNLSIIQTIQNRQICQLRQRVVFMDQNDLETSEEDKKDYTSKVHQISLTLKLAL